MPREAAVAVLALWEEHDYSRPAWHAPRPDLPLPPLAEFLRKLFFVPMPPPYAPYEPSVLHPRRHKLTDPPPKSRYRYSKKVAERKVGEAIAIAVQALNGVDFSEPEILESDVYNLPILAPPKTPVVTPTRSMSDPHPACPATPDRPALVQVVHCADAAMSSALLRQRLVPDIGYSPHAVAREEVHAVTPPPRAGNLPVVRVTRSRSTPLQRTQLFSGIYSSWTCHSFPMYLICWRSYWHE